MRFENHFLSTDIPMAELAFKNITASLSLINSYVDKQDYSNAERMAINLLEELEKINKLSVKRESENRMYFHHLMNQTKGWFPL